MKLMNDFGRGGDTALVTSSPGQPLVLPSIHTYTYHGVKLKQQQQTFFVICHEVVRETNEKE